MRRGICAMLLLVTVLVLLPGHDCSRDWHHDKAGFGNSRVLKSAQGESRPTWKEIQEAAKNARERAGQEAQEAVEPLNQSAAWDEYKAKYNGSRRGIAGNRTAFVEALSKIVSQNALSHSTFFKMGPLIDLDDSTFKTGWHGLHKLLPEDRPTDDKVINDSSPTPPDAINWVEKGVMTPVKNQGNCGSCWTFATTAAVEGLNAIKSEYTSLYSLSEQQVLDCGSTNSPNEDGCQGNSIDAGLSYTLTNGGLTSGDAYPYTAVDNTCKVEAEAWKVSKINSYTWVPANDETALMKAVAYGPVIVGISASTDLFKLYGGGVISDFSRCCPAGNNCATDIDHAVVVVGYNKTADAPYWLLRNSWGADWGMDGYFMLAMGKTTGFDSGMCGILRSPVMPTMGKPGPPSGTPPPNAPPLTNMLSTTTTLGSGAFAVHATAVSAILALVSMLVAVLV